MSLKLNLKICGFTHKGKIREHNEDSIAIADWLSSENMKIPKQFEFSIVSSQDAVVCIVADGIGGNASGEIASRFVADYLSQNLIMIENEESLKSALLEANKALFTEMNTDLDNYKGMGTTIAGMYMTSEASFIFNVGDSRIYRYASNTLQLLTTDDTMPRMITLPDGRQVLKRSILTQCFGGSNQLMQIKPHISTIKIMPNENYILCSDGLSDMVSDDLIQHKIKTEDNVATMRDLFTSAMHSGGRDNFSAIVIQVS